MSRTEFVNLINVIILLIYFICLGIFVRPPVIEITNNKTHFVTTNSSSIFEVTATYYNPVNGQCDRTPLVTADGSHIDMDLLVKGELRWIAVSWDLLKKYNGPFDYGDTIYVFHTNPKLRGYWVIHDCMNSRYTRFIDFLVSGEKKFPGRTVNVLISNSKFYD